MTSGPSPISDAVVRGFWHGRQLGPYELLCLRSFVRSGHRFELFTYDPQIVVPDGVVRRDAREILPADQVMTYRHDWGAGSPSLHSNIFRYCLLHQLGGWWVDLDILLVRPDLPSNAWFVAGDARGVAISAALRFPPGDPIMEEAIRRSRAISEDKAQWGETGPDLLNELIAAFGRRGLMRPTHEVSPFDYYQIEMLFDPGRCEQVRETIDGAIFVHLFHQLNRSSGIPFDAGPPEGSFLDRMFVEHKTAPCFSSRLRYPDVKTAMHNFIAHLHYKGLYRSIEAENEKLKAQIGQFQQERSQVG